MMNLIRRIFCSKRPKPTYHRKSRHTTCKDWILIKLLLHEPRAIHEFQLIGYSENNVGTRLPELYNAGLVANRYRPDTAYKEWRLTDAGRAEAAILWENFGR